MALPDADPREIAGIINAVPKRNLEELLDSRGLTKEGFSVSIGKDKRIANKWIRGKRRMSNNELLLVSSALDVSPLYLLDLTAWEWPNISELLDINGDGPSERRLSMGADIGWLYAPDEAVYNAIYKTVDGNLRFRASGTDIDFPVCSDGNAMSAEEIKQRIRCELAAIEGDYRDLGKLSLDTLNSFLDPHNHLQPDNAVDLMAQIITSAARGRVTSVTNYGD